MLDGSKNCPVILYLSLEYYVLLVHAQQKGKLPDGDAILIVAFAVIFEVVQEIDSLHAGRSYI